MSLAQDKRLTRLYGVPAGWYDLTLEEQGGGCEICDTPPKTGRRLHVDHDHQPPWRARGLLCWRCNKLLGVAHDKINVLYNASLYLAKHRDNPLPYCCPKPIKRRRRKRKR